MPQSPVVAAWELALMLRNRRAEMGIDVNTLTRLMSFSRNYWSAVENQRKILSEESLTRLLDVFEFDHEERRELLALRDTAKQRGWWTKYSRLSNENVQRFYGLEYGAESVLTYENLIVPGLLQTPDYSRAMMTSDVTVRPVEIEQLIDIRQQRQRRLNGDDPLHLTAVISQAVLLQETGGPKVLRDQLRHLVKVVEQHPDTIDLHVIPFTVRWCPLFGSATIHLIDFPGSTLPTVIFRETVTIFDIIDDPLHVRDLKTAYSEAIRQALTMRESLDMIDRRIKELA